MTDPDRLEQLLRAALPPADGEPAADLWPRVLARVETPPAWSRIDIGLAGLIGITLLLYPEGLYLLAFHF